MKKLEEEKKQEQAKMKKLEEKKKQEKPRERVDPPIFCGTTIEDDQSVVSMGVEEVKETPMEV